MSWQQQRAMTPVQFERALHALGLSQAAAARFLGSTARQVRRQLVGERKVSTPTALLLRVMIAHGERPVVPQRSKGPQW